MVWWVALVLGAFLLGCLLLWRPLSGFFQDVRAEKAKELFALERERLEAKFGDVAAASGRPRGLRWKHIEWDDGVVFLRGKANGELVALVGITIFFEPIEGEALERNPNARVPRDATAVFQFTNQHWVATGRVLFNMDPALAVRHYESKYEVLTIVQGGKQQHADNA